MREATSASFKQRFDEKDLHNNIIDLNLGNNRRINMNVMSYAIPTDSLLRDGFQLFRQKSFSVKFSPTSSFKSVNLKHLPTISKDTFKIRDTPDINEQSQFQRSSSYVFRSLQKRTPKSLYFQDTPGKTKIIKGNILWSGNKNGRLWHLKTFSRINSVDPYTTRNENLREKMETSNQGYGYIWRHKYK